jgi:hypothetical protein
VRLYDDVEAIFRYLQTEESNLVVMGRSIGSLPAGIIPYPNPKHYTSNLHTENHQTRTLTPTLTLILNTTQYISHIFIPI